jgi:hypothetical protein
MRQLRRLLVLAAILGLASIPVVAQETPGHGDRDQDRPGMGTGTDKDKGFGDTKDHKDHKDLYGGVKIRDVNGKDVKAGSVVSLKGQLMDLHSFCAVDKGGMGGMEGRTGTTGTDRTGGTGGTGTDRGTGGAGGVGGGREGVDREGGLGKLGKDQYKKNVEMGIPLVLVCEGQPLIVYFSPENERLFKQAKELIGQQVEVKGKFFQRAGLVGVEIQEIKETTAS